MYRLPKKPFKLDFLESYDDEALIAEIRRVAELVATAKLTRVEFEKHARIGATILRRRFGSWKAALELAGLGERFDGSSRPLSREEVLEAMRRTAAALHKDSLTFRELQLHTRLTIKPIHRLFGSWKHALKMANLSQAALGKRYTDEECFENLLAVWTHYGRAPEVREMNDAPSLVGSKGYIKRWGTWRKSLAAFVTYANSDIKEQSPQVSAVRVLEALEEDAVKKGPRDVPLSVRYKVLKRDNFRCVTCGASPALNIGTVLHVDHIHPWALGGATVFDNLRTLCEKCNLGKGIHPA